MIYTYASNVVFDIKEVEHNISFQLVKVWFIKIHIFQFQNELVFMIEIFGFYNGNAKYINK